MVLLTSKLMPFNGGKQLKIRICEKQPSPSMNTSLMFSTSCFSSSSVKVLLCPPRFSSLDSSSSLNSFILSILELKVMYSVPSMEAVHLIAPCFFFFVSSSNCKNTFLHLTTSPVCFSCMVFLCE